MKCVNFFLCPFPSVRALSFVLCGWKRVLSLGYICCQQQPEPGAPCQGLVKNQRVNCYGEWQREGTLDLCENRPRTCKICMPLHAISLCLYIASPHQLILHSISMTTYLHVQTVRIPHILSYNPSSHPTTFIALYVPYTSW